MNANENVEGCPWPLGVGGRLSGCNDVTRRSETRFILTGAKDAVAEEAEVSRSFSGVL
ncbi:hypothetical protein K0M31_015913 [Melipona bicolor]|uniref:Uncharacterized protein n=1 Tax=Melipona bicolor TaxID=60889 RepID=A0AA40G6F0_9HYME|nr:hypothetical protein K0M31_015913 [Melipona bicolor]